MKSDASASIIWHGNQFMGMESDFIEHFLGGLYRSSINDTNFNTFAPNAIIVVQETFPVVGKREFWEPFVSYLKEFKAMEFSVSVFLTSDEKYLAPFDWVDDVDLYLRNCWHPALEEMREKVVALPFGFKSGFYLPSELRRLGSVSPSSCRGILGRKFVWNFIGNANCSTSREKLVEEIFKHGKPRELQGFLHLTHTFDDPFHGLGVQQYRRVLEDSAFTFCPEGVHVESYRLTEAIESGSVPIVTCNYYFDGLFGDAHVLPCVNDWSWEELQAVMESVKQRLAGDPCYLQSWWHSWKLSKKRFLQEKLARRGRVD
mmetsp:Transcript_39334/g.123991  ORF Transcript_39334/g.123991 Transcript_39334/m.123991 type:complete len:316 (-) Transcript_39334:199-1146(-)